MPKCRVIRSGWMWKGVPQQVGTVITESAEWIANRVRDGLVEPIADEPVIEEAVKPAAPERAVAPRGKKKN